MEKMWKFKGTLIVVIFILIGILMPGGSVPSIGIPGLDKVVHFGMFFTLAAVFCLEYLMNHKKMPRISYVIVCIGVFAISTEVMQLFAVNRSFDLKDFLADMVGCTVAIILWKSVLKFKVIDKYLKNTRSY